MMNFSASYYSYYEKKIAIFWKKMSLLKKKIHP